jgi:LmbE family N-acetylglucosaminyl deacetylase
MRRYRVSLVVVLAALAPIALTADGPADATGARGVALWLRKLATFGTVMHATAHPDDENNGLLAMQSHGQGFRVVLATATRGNGGQNEIGPELFEPLGVLRTEELLAAHHYDGAEQFFARAVDFGYSFSVEESYEKWGRKEIVGDYVRLIRMTRPDVLMTMRPDGPGGGQHHQASARLAAEAAALSGDPAQYPEQIAEGLHAWQPRKVYKVAFYGFGDPEPPAGTKLLPVDVSVYDPLLGNTYQEIGAKGRSMHKCQGMGQLLPLPGTFAMRYQLIATTLSGGLDRSETTLTDGLDLTVPGLAAFAGANPPSQLTDGLASVASAVKTASIALGTNGPDASVPELAHGLAASRELASWIKGASGINQDAQYEIDTRLAQTEHKFEQALVLAQGLRIETLSDDGVVVPGQPVALTVIVANRGGRAITLRTAATSGFADSRLDCARGEVAPGGIVKCQAKTTIPSDARTTEPYWHRAGEAGRYTFDADAPFGLPFRPTPFQAVLDLEIGGVHVPVRKPFEYRYEGNLFSGEKRMELKVVPAITLRVTPETTIVPAPVGPGPQHTAATNHHTAEPSQRIVQVSITNNAPGPADTDVHLEGPDGWVVTPASTHVRFERGDEGSVLTFSVAPPPRVALGSYPLRAVAGPDAKFTRGYTVVEYPHTHRRHVFEDAQTLLKVVDVRIPEHLTIGYVMGVGDQVPIALEQIGAHVTLLDENALASQDLSGFDAIVTGVRAYERRKDLRMYNRRLLEYASGGGTVVVQYNKFEFNQAQYAPYPAKVSNARVTDEHAPVTILDPSNPVFTTPNRIGESAWQNWVQERGLYFLGERDPKYVDLVQLEDPFELNSGSKGGALVEATVGKGRWLYVGLGLWRQLPAGTDGAYQLMANLVSLSRTVHK